MRSERFHRKGEKPTAIVVDEASRLTIEGTAPVHVFQLDDNGKKVKLLKTGTHYKIKLHDVEEIWMESNGDFNSVIEGADKIDNTPLEVPVEAPMSQTQYIRRWLQNEENLRNYSKHELTWDEFKDLGDLDDGDNFYGQFNQDMTKYEMQAEALRQETNPFRGNPVSDKVDEINTDSNNGGDEQHAENNANSSTQNDTPAVSD